MARQQLSLFTKSNFPNLSGVELEFGGRLRKGRRKIARPVDSRRPMHVVLRSSRAHGKWSMLRKLNRKAVEKVLKRGCERYDVKLLSKANVGNHIHLILKAKTRNDFQGFMRVVAGRIAANITGAKKGNAVGRFWDHLAYSRVVAWGRDYINTQIYLTKNLFEGEGVELLTLSGIQRFRLRYGKLAV